MYHLRPHHALPTRAHPLPARRLTAVVDPKMPSSKPKCPRHLHQSASASALNLPPKDNPNAPTPIQKCPHHPPLRSPPSRIATPHHQVGIRRGVRDKLSKALERRKRRIYSQPSISIASRHTTSNAPSRQAPALHPVVAMAIRTQTPSSRKERLSLLSEY